MRVAKIETSKHKQERVLVFLEGEKDPLRLTEAELLRFGLFTGMEIGEDELPALRQAAHRSQVKADGARIASSAMVSMVTRSFRWTCQMVPFRTSIACSTSSPENRKFPVSSVVRRPGIRSSNCFSPAEAAIGLWALSKSSIVGTIRFSRALAVMAARPSCMRRRSARRSSGFLERKSPGTNMTSGLCRIWAWSSWSRLWKSEGSLPHS